MTKDNRKSSAWFHDDIQRKDRSFVLKVVSEFGNELEFADASLRADREIVLAAISADGQSFRYANKALRKDRDFVLQVVRINPRSLLHADPVFRKDREVVLDAAASNPEWVYRFADKGLQNDRILQAMVLASRVGVRVIYEEGLIRNTYEIVSKGVSEIGSSALNCILPIPKPISSEYWQLIVRGAFLDVERTICRRGQLSGPFTGRAWMTVDIALLIDLSESMRPCFDAIKNHIGSLLSGLDHLSHDEYDYSAEWASSIVPLIKRWRVKICGYHDAKTEPVDLLQESQFMDSATSITSCLESIELRGGDHEPRPLLDGLWRLANMNSAEDEKAPDDHSWSAAREEGQINLRLVLVFTDSPCHMETKGSEAAGATFDDVAKDVMASKLNILLVAPELDCFLYELSSIDMLEAILV